MPRKNTVVEASKRSKDWPEFMNRLAEVLGCLEEDQYLIINAKHTNLYVQFAGQGSYGLRAEAVSNHYLNKGEKLGRNQVAALKAMGWQAPTGGPKRSTPRKDPDGSPNFFVDFSVPLAAERIAGMAVETFAGIFGVTHPGELEYEAFDSNGGTLMFQRLGLKLIVKKESGEVAVTTAEALLQTLRRVTGLDSLEPDEDGDISARYGSVMIYARVFDSPEVVHIFSPLVREVEESSELFERLNRLNQGSREMRYFFVDGTVIAATDVRASPFVEANIKDAYRHFSQVADDVDNLLQSEFGGKTMFPEWVPSTVRH